MPQTPLATKSSLERNLTPGTALGVWARLSGGRPLGIVLTHNRDGLVATSVQRRGWAVVKKDQRPDRERARAIKSRQRAIGRELRRLYDDVAQEPVPDDFLDLLKKMDRREPGEGGDA
jgi:Anti-sigma factor NepR